MGQQQIRVSVSLSTKLLTSVLFLLLLVIVGINASTFWIVSDDKRAYTFQSLSTQTALIGQEFSGTSRRALDQLRLVLAQIDPRRPSNPSAQAAIKGVLESQQDLLQIRLDLLQDTAGEMTLRGHSAGSRTDLAEKENWKPEQSQPTAEQLKSLMPGLLERGYGFLNLSYAGGPPVVGVFYADLKLKGQVAGLPIAWGVFSLAAAQQELRNGFFSIRTTDGLVLYDSNVLKNFNSKTDGADPLFEVARKSATARGSQEYESDGKRWLGSFVRPGLDVVILSRVGWDKVMQATYALIEKFIFIGLLSLGLGIVFSLVFARRLTAPLSRLFEATKQVAQGNFHLMLQGRSDAKGDEIDALTQSFQVMSGKITALIAESMKKVQLENELAIASTVQQNLIPPARFENSKILIHSHYQSASECGGDWWGFFGVGNRISLMIADATGHGLPSALITAAARSCFSVMAKLAQEDPDFGFSPRAMLSYANRVVFDAALGKINMTFFVAVLDLDQKTLSYSNAGHNPPWLFQNREGKLGVKSLMAQGPRLGEKRDVFEFEEHQVAVEPNDILFLYTDGLVEGKNPAGDQFGKKRVRKLVEQSITQGPEAVIKTLVQEFLQHNASKPLDDDLTIAAAQIRVGGPV